MKKPTKGRPGHAADKPAKAQNKTRRPRTIDVAIKTVRHGGDSEPIYQVVKAAIDDDERISLDLTIQVRATDSVEIRPLRRALTDRKGMLRDAEELANRD